MKKRQVKFKPLPPYSPPPFVLPPELDTNEEMENEFLSLLDPIEGEEEEEEEEEEEDMTNEFANLMKGEYPSTDEPEVSQVNAFALYGLALAVSKEASKVDAELTKMNALIQASGYAKMFSRVDCRTPGMLHLFAPTDSAFDRSEAMKRVFNSILTNESRAQNLMKNFVASTTEEFGFYAVQVDLFSGETIQVFPPRFDPVPGHSDEFFFKRTLPGNKGKVYLNFARGNPIPIPRRHSQDCDCSKADPPAKDFLYIMDGL